MSKDELRQPLQKKSPVARLWSRRPNIFTLACFALCVGFGVGAYGLLRTKVPFAGEPVYVAVVPKASELTTSSVTRVEMPQPMDKINNDREEDIASEPPPSDDLSIQEEASDSMAGMAMTPDNYNVGDKVTIITPQRSLIQAPIASISEAGAYGMLPRVGAGYKKPSELYARALPMAVQSSSQPKIVLVLGGMGLNAKLTQRASRKLPNDVTFAFAPYGDDLQEQVNKVRNAGHEVLLQLPMEPPGYPGNNPGPKTLITNGDRVANLDALMWHMSRFSGYSGISNYMGGRFLADMDAAKPILAEIAKRGLVFLADDTIPQANVEKLARLVNLPAQRAHLVIDTNPDPTSIRDALSRLEDEAQQNGYAIGTGTGLDVTIDIVANWARRLQDKGILLVPASAVYKNRRS